MQVFVKMSGITNPLPPIYYNITFMGGGGYLILGGRRGGGVFNIRGKGLERCRASKSLEQTQQTSPQQGAQLSGDVVLVDSVSAISMCSPDCIEDRPVKICQDVSTKRGSRSFACFCWRAYRMCQPNGAPEVSRKHIDGYAGNIPRLLFSIFRRHDDMCVSCDNLWDLLHTY